MAGWKKIISRKNNLDKMEQDPAIATGPFVTIAIDILGILVYFLIASRLL